MENKYGKKYFDYQRPIGEIGGVLNKFKFEPYIKESDVVLDFGCGGGYLLSELNCKTKLGIEVNKEAIKEAEKNGVKVYESIAGIKDNSVDVIISNHTLEHIEDPVNKLRDLYRVLKKGGKIVIVTPYNGIFTAKGFNPKEVNMHLYTWNTQLMGNLLKISGFKNIQPKVLTQAWRPYYYKIYKINKLIYRMMTWFTAKRLGSYQVHAVAEK